MNYGVGTVKFNSQAHKAESTERLIGFVKRFHDIRQIAVKKVSVQNLERIVKSAKKAGNDYIIMEMNDTHDPVFFHNAMVESWLMPVRMK